MMVKSEMRSCVDDDNINYDHCDMILMITMLMIQMRTWGRMKTVKSEEKKDNIISYL